MNGLAILIIALLVFAGAAEQAAPGCIVTSLTAYERVMANSHLPGQIDSAMLPLMPRTP